MKMTYHDAAEILVMYTNLLKQCLRVIRKLVPQYFYRIFQRFRMLSDHMSVIFGNRSDRSPHRGQETGNASIHLQQWLAIRRVKFDIEDL
jgi:hypothetical protein